MHHLTHLPFTWSLKVSAAILVLFLVALLPTDARAQTLVYTFSSPNAQTPGEFGAAVATGDVNGDGKADIAVGAPHEQVGSNSDQGRVYVYSGATGALLYTLTDPAPQAGEVFGVSVAMGDLNGDGKADIIVGASGATMNGNASQGRVVLFNGATGAPFFLSTLTTPDHQVQADFGQSVAAADLNGDGKAEVIVGAPGATVGSNADQGRVYVFDVNAFTVLYTFDTPNPENLALFGTNLAVGDVNGDGTPDVIVGSPNQTVIARSGRVHVFSGKTGTLLWNLTTLNPQGGNEAFGDAVAAADVNGDGKADILIGAYGENVGSNQTQGRAYVVSGATGGLLYTLTTPYPQASEAFGESVALADLNGDNVPDIIVGALTAVSGAINIGQVYAFSGTNGALFTTFNTPNPLVGGYNDFSEALATGNVNGAGPADVVVGALGEKVGSFAIAGRAYVLAYDGTPGCPPTGCPAPSVGGVAEQPDVAALPSTSSPSHDYIVYILGGAVALIVTAAGAAVWRRRRM